VIAILIVFAMAFPPTADDINVIANDKEAVEALSEAGT